MYIDIYIDYFLLSINISLCIKLSVITFGPNHNTNEGKKILNMLKKRRSVLLVVFFLLNIILITLYLVSVFQTNEQHVFTMDTNHTMDVVIPVALKDKLKLKKSLQGILENSLTPIHKVYIVASNENILKDLNNIKTNVKIIFISEVQFPFSKDDIEKILYQKNSKYNHASWYHQQLLKFYVFKVIPNLFENVLILDSDFIFKEKVSFLTEDNRAILAYGYPFKWILNTTQYPKKIEHSHIDFAKKFILTWETMNSFSGMQHHMLFQKYIIESIFKDVEIYHKKDFWKAFMDTVDIKKWNAASEYVIYFHFAIKNYPNNLKLRHLNSYDIIYDSEESNDNILQLLDQLNQQSNYKAVGFHSFINLEKRLKSMDYIIESLRKKMLDEKPLCFILKLNNSMLQVTSYSNFLNN